MIKPTDEFPYVLYTKDYPDGLRFKTRFDIMYWLYDTLSHINKMRYKHFLNS